MLLYWFLFLVPAYFALTGRVGGGTAGLTWKVFGLFLVAIIGLRYQVGGDWFTYLEGLEIAKDTSWDGLFDFRKEAGFTLLSWASLSVGAGIYGVNAVCAALFAYGLIKLARRQPYPWLAIAVAVPYLVIVVAMGYTRQAAALGILMAAFGLLLDKRVLAFLLAVIVAGLFHKTAFVFLAFGLLRPGSSLWVKLLGVALLVGLTAGTLVLEQAEFLMRVYVEQTMESSGGQIRVLMNLPPALILFLFWKKWGRLYEDRWLWGLFALLALVCVPLVAVASTAVDRMALYLIPLQLVVWSRLPELLKGIVPRIYVFLFVLGFYAAVQFVWLVYGTHAPYWVPYDNVLFPDF